MAKAIMIQGTMSNAGKSVLCAGLCRILHQDGYKVAPFKSQNMALNSFVTAEGLEMGRAQVMQAECAGTRPSVRMNPILLKPTSDMGSQVIVNGEVLENMPAAEYFRYKRQLIPQIMEAYTSLAREYDIIVLEGAGSPAEINLKAEDIVNMGMARMAHAPVLLAGDIDRGGVFASLYGTVALLEPWEKTLLKGTIINKFRGDMEILRPGLDMLERLTGLPVLGVVPWLELDLDEEDSLSSRLEVRRRGAPLEIAVIHLPHIANFTDFAPLERHGAVGLYYASSPEELGSPDLVILPGTKNTMDDLRWLRRTGLDSSIQKLHAKDVPVIGVCGGYQMLGQTVSDPEGVESGGELPGLGLLPVSTVFSTRKTRLQTAGTVGELEGFFAPLSGCPVEGYELHMGVDRYNLFTAQDRVLGTYLHGLFDSVPFTETLIRLLLEQKGVEWQGEAPKLSLQEYKQRQYDRLADALRQSLNMERIYQIIEEGISDGMEFTI